MIEEASVPTAAQSPRLAERAARAARVVAREAAAAFARTPLEVLLGASTAIGFSIALEREEMETWAHLLVAVGIALPLVYASSVLAVRGAIGAPVRWAVSAAAVASGAAYGFLVFDPDRLAEAWRAWLLVGSAVAALACVPLVRPRPGDRREQVHRFIARIVARIVLVMAYAGALWVGLALALAAVNGLFELHLDDKAWAHLASALFILLPPWAVAAGLPALLAPLEPWREEDLRLFRRLGAFLLAPLVLIYLGIVYAYTVRVLVTGEVPKNLVSPVVIGAGLLIVACTVALEAVHGDERAGGVSLLVRLASPLLLPLVLFAIWAVSARVDQYGWTEFRYLRLLALVLLAAYGAAAAYRLFRRRPPPLTVVPAALAVVLLLAAVGPWSATAVAHRSQAGSLRALLAVANKRGHDPAVAIPPATFRGITDKSAYLRGHFGWPALQAVVPWVGSAPARGIPAGEYASRVGIVERVEAGMTRVVNARLQVERGVPGVAGGTLYGFEAQRGPVRPGPRGGKAPSPVPVAGAPGQLVVAIDSVTGRLRVVPPGGDTLLADLAPLMRALLERSASQTGSPIYERKSDTQPNVETGRALDVELAPGDAIQPLLGRDGRSAGQLVLRHLEFEALPGAAAPGARSAPATPGAAGVPAPATLRLRSAGGSVLLTAAAPPAR